MLTRRTALRSFSFAALAVSSARLLSACAGDSPPRASDAGGRTEITLVSSDLGRNPADPATVPPAVKSLHALGAGLVGTALAGSGNAAVSPYSVGVALGMAVVGSRGTTERSMLDVLAADDSAALAGGLNALTQHVEGLAGEVEVLGEQEELVLDAANSLFGQAGTAWEQPFLDTLATRYGAGLRQVDFVGATESAREVINAWTAEQTRDRIDEIIPEGAVSIDTRLVLVNALYLKAPWAAPFEETATRAEDFHLAGGETVRVPTMHEPSLAAATGAGDGWRSVRLPYGGGRLAMTVVLPDEGRLADVEAALAGGALPAVLAAGHSPNDSTVDLALPRWTFRTQLPLGEALGELGMGVAFTAEADFSGMAGSDRLQIAEVLHEVFVAVDEHGTEAAAATAVLMETRSAPATGVPFVVDRPFLFVIHDVEHGTPLFLGRVADPRAT